MDPLSTTSLCEQFLAERRYLKNVTPSTIEWYETAFNAFCRWLHEGGHHQERLELPTLRVEKLIIQTLNDDDIRRLLTVKPKRFDQWRLHALIALLPDTGIRIEEGLSLRLSGVDFDNLLVTVYGKGRKERRIPFSLELRKVLFRYIQIRGKQPLRSDLLFPSRQGTTWDQRNSLRGRGTTVTVCPLGEISCTPRRCAMRRTLIAVAAVIGVILSGASTGLTQNKPSATLPIKGVWKRTSTVTTGANASTVSNWSPSVYIYTDRHYSHVFESNGVRRQPLAAPKDPNKLTDAEKLAQREAWAPFTANSGTYEIKGSGIIHHQLVAKAPAPATGYADTVAGFENVRIDGNTMLFVLPQLRGRELCAQQRRDPLVQRPANLPALPRHRR
jgi:hypothetical protein